MQNRIVPDIENAMYKEIDKEMAKMRKDMNIMGEKLTKLNESVDTSCAGKCAEFFAGLTRLGMDILLVYIAVRVLQ